MIYLTNTFKKDDWSRPIYKDQDGKTYVDTDLGGNPLDPNIHTVSADYGEPCSPVARDKFFLCNGEWRVEHSPLKSKSGVGLEYVPAFHVKSGDREISEHRYTSHHYYDGEKNDPKFIEQRDRAKKIAEFIARAPRVEEVLQEVKECLDREFQTKDQLIPAPIVQAYELINSISTTDED